MKALEIAMRSKAGIIWIRSREEVRVERRVTELCLGLKYQVRYWSVSRGLENPDGSNQVPAAAPPEEVLGRIAGMKQRTAFVLRDLGPWLGDPLTLRKFKDLHRDLPRRPITESVQVVVLDAGEPPAGLQCVSLTWPLPDRDEICEILDGLLEMASEGVAEDVARNGARDRIVDAAVGLSGDQIRGALAKSLVEVRGFDPAIIAAEKKEAVRGSGLEWKDPEPAGLAAIGGLDNLKAWLLKRHAGFTAAGREYGLPAPKGVLLVGVPGCGKSLSAKAVAACWGIPLMRLDIGALFTKWVGESEEKVRDALALAETIAPCVLWVDELEKSGFGSQGDGGTSERVLGTFLTWMQEREAPVFVVATANDVGRLPPELLRAGRWDDVFAVDLPTLQERHEIVGVMKGRFAKCEKVHQATIACASEGYTGAELEAAFKAALYTQFAAGGGDVETEAVAAELQVIVPIAESSREKVGAIREWAKGRARPASTVRAPGQDGHREVELE